MTRETEEEATSRRAIIADFSLGLLTTVCFALGVMLFLTSMWSELLLAPSEQVDMPGYSKSQVVLMTAVGGLALMALSFVFAILRERWVGGELP